MKVREKRRKKTESIRGCVSGLGFGVGVRGEGG